MNPEDWERIKRVFSAALGVAAEARDAYVHEACADRPDLADAVNELLAANYEASSTFLEPGGGLLFDAPWLFRPGDRVAERFEIVRTIARGQMGEVYEARDHRLQERIALKALRPQLVGDAQTAERFRREVLVTRDIAHDSLCRIIDLIEHPVAPGGLLQEHTVVPCLTMQLLEGQSLEAYLRAHRPLTLADALPLVSQIAGALDVLHDRGVVHRDLKPSNVVLVERGGQRRAVLTDFGLAKPLDESLFETQARVQGGAPFYMAPELFSGERPSRASDIYAFGLLIDELVTRQRAFAADSLHGLMLEKLQGDPPPPSARADALPPQWDQAIRRCLAREPAARFARATDVCKALEGEAQPAPASPRRPWAFLPSRRWRWAALAATALVAVASLAVTNGPVTAASPMSVVVQPFENLTRDPTNDYLSRGTGSELGRRLKAIQGLVIYAPATMMTPADPEDEATFALRGFVQKAGPVLRLTVELTDRRQGRLVWSQNYEGFANNALQLEDRLAQEAAGALAKEAYRQRQGPVWSVLSWVPFVGPEPPNVPAGGTRSNAAYDAYIRGRDLFERRTLESAIAAMSLLNQAVEIDPAFAAPYATLSDVQQVLMDHHYRPHDELLRQAERYAQQAVFLDPNLPDGQLSLASVRQMQARWSEAEDAFRKTRTLHPTFARAHRWYAGMLLQFARYDEALSLTKQALELDPYDASGQSFYGLALFYSNRPEDAARQLEHLVASRGDLVSPHMILGQVYAFLAGKGETTRDGYRQKALAQSAVLHDRELATAAALGPKAGPVSTEFSNFVAALAWSYGGDRAAAQPFVDRLEAQRRVGLVSPSILARVYAAQGRTEAAFQALDDSEAQHDRELMYLSVSPLYRAIRSDPRFDALRRRMSLIE
jgi:serine/threonine protein kinase